MYVCTYVCMYICMYMYVRVYIYMCVYACSQISVCARVVMFVDAAGRGCMCVVVCLCVRVCTHTCLQDSLCVIMQCVHAWAWCIDWWMNGCLHFQVLMSKAGVLWHFMLVKKLFYWIIMYMVSIWFAIYEAGKSPLADYDSTLISLCFHYHFYYDFTMISLWLF